MDKCTFIMLFYKSLVRPHLKYANCQLGVVT